MSVFEDVRARVRMSDAISYLKLEQTERNGDQIRFKCPHCSGNDKRALSVNVASEKFQCFTAKKGGNDATALVAHCRGMSQTEAAKLLYEQFCRSSTEARPAKAERKGRSDPPQGEVRPLEILGISDEAAKRLDIREVDGGILFAQRDEQGIRIGTLVIATREDLPLIEWMANNELDVDTKPKAAEGLHGLWRLVKGGK